MPNILFRADAEKTIGTGDLVSLIYLSYEFRRHGWESFFMVRDYGPALAIIKKRRLKNVSIIPATASIQSEIGLIKRECNEKKIDCLFMEITKHRLSRYKNLGRPAPVKACVNFDGVITDDFDIVINWCEPSDSRLYTGYMGKQTLFMLGFEKTILPHYIDRQRIIRRRYSRKPKNILVVMGGVDEFNLTKKTASLFRQRSCPYKVRIILGPGYRYKSDLIKSCILGFPHMAVKENVGNLFEDYIWADIAFCTGGLVSSELVATKTPAILIAAYPHQVKRCEYFFKNGLAYYCGQYAECDENSLHSGLSYAIRNIICLRDSLRAFKFRGGNEEIFKNISSYRQSGQLV